jgi:alcohol dehydrogenase class IV
MKFQLLFSSKIIFENGIIKKIGSIIRNDFKNPLIITGGNSLKNSGYYDVIIEELTSEKINYAEYQGINSEPTPGIIDEVVKYAIDKKARSIISIGGGSVIDTGKAVAALVTNEQGVENYLEGVGKDYKIINTPLPFIAVPTTAGSGAEVTKNAVITSYDKKYKKSFRDEKIIAKLVIADPGLTVTLPKKETAFGGMDAICQLLESFVTKNNNVYTKSLSNYFLPLAIKSITNVYNNPDNLESRSLMLSSSIASGIALANSGLGAVHGFASGIGGIYNIPHGLICAVLLPGICEINAGKNKQIYDDAACLINNDKSSNVNKMISLLYELNRKLDIPENFKYLNFKNVDLKELVEISKGSSMNGNPVELSDEELLKFIEKYF